MSAPDKLPFRSLCPGGTFRCPGRGGLCENCDACASTEGSYTLTDVARRLQTPADVASFVALVDGCGGLTRRDRTELLDSMISVRLTDHRGGSLLVRLMLGGAPPNTPKSEIDAWAAEVTKDMHMIIQGYTPEQSKHSECWVHPSWLVPFEPLDTPEGDQS